MACGSAVAKIWVLHLFANEKGFSTRQQSGLENVPWNLLSAGHSSISGAAEAAANRQVKMALCLTRLATTFYTGLTLDALSGYSLLISSVPKVRSFGSSSCWVMNAIISLSFLSSLSPRRTVLRLLCRYDGTTVFCRSLSFY
jgi:hypothetical protein